MKRLSITAILLVFACLFTACDMGTNDPLAVLQADMVEVSLSDNGITVDGKVVRRDERADIYMANDIVYYESGKDFTYGEGGEKDAHSAEEAASHTVLHITKPGVYSLSGKLSHGQIAVDLGNGAKKDPDAVVTLVLNGVDITCTVAPAVIFYNVYECGNNDADEATKDVDTSAAGANVIIADGTVNTVNGSHVARIYDPDSVVLNAAKTEVEEADKLHKYDGAFYSKRSLNIRGGKEGTGILNIHADNEGLNSEMHLTLSGGNVHITSGNDGINTNEDGVSVTTINGGTLTIQVTGETGEGDGIDSNGWLVINGGTVTAMACSDSMDAGVDADKGIYLNGGVVTASGNMLDRIENGGQNYAVFHFAQKQIDRKSVTLKNANSKAIVEFAPQNAYSVLIVSSPTLQEGAYTLWSGDRQLAGQRGELAVKPGGVMPPDGKPPHPDPMRPDGRPVAPNDSSMGLQSRDKTFSIQKGANVFHAIAPLS